MESHILILSPRHVLWVESFISLSYYMSHRHSSSFEYEDIPTYILIFLSKHYVNSTCAPMIIGISIVPAFITLNSSSMSSWRFMISIIHFLHPFIRVYSFVSRSVRRALCVSCSSMMNVDIMSFVTFVITIVMYLPVFLYMNDFVTFSVSHSFPYPIVL